MKVKEAARAAAVAERDRVVEAVKECTEGPALVEAAERVGNEARMVEVLEREVADSAAPVEIGGWQIAGVRREDRLGGVPIESSPGRGAEEDATGGGGQVTRPSRSCQTRVGRSEEQRLNSSHRR